MSVYIRDLRGKYHGTEVWVEDEVICGEPTDFIITVWTHSSTPSDRELAQYGITREQWDNNEMVDSGCGDGSRICVRNPDITCDGHFESVQSLKIAEAICGAIQNVVKENP